MSEETNNTLRAGQKLQNGQSIKSLNGNYKLVVQNDGNVVLYDTVEKKATWSTKTSKHGTGHTYTFVVQHDRHLVLYKGVLKAENHIWASRTNVSGHSSIQLVLNNDGTLIASSDAGIFWKAGKQTKSLKIRIIPNYWGQTQNAILSAENRIFQLQNDSNYLQSQIAYQSSSQSLMNNIAAQRKLFI